MLNHAENVVFNYSLEHVSIPRRPFDLYYPDWIRSRSNISIQEKEKRSLFDIRYSYDSHQLSHGI
ncbi:MAG: hypothetical protein ACJA08_002359 [Cyclobacteriaceae bacterium]|jgi:hypothetical protein